ncbi:hypothetical protein ScPMuIL_011157 [Solemya velum]
MRNFDLLLILTTLLTHAGGRPYSRIDDCANAMAVCEYKCQHYKYDCSICARNFFECTKPHAKKRGQKKRRSD